MAINYELLNKGGISLGTNFELLSEKPLDSRLVVPSLDGLQNYIDNAAAYEGMIAYVTSEKKHYEVKIIDGVLSYRPFGLTDAELKALIASETTAAMEFMGVTATLPGNPSNGDMYKVGKVGDTEPDITIDGIAAKAGDAIVAKVVVDGEVSTTTWYLIPSGDDIEDTWRPVDGVNNDATLKFANGDKTVAAVAADGTIKYNHATVAAPTDVTEDGDEKTRTYITAVETDGYGHITGYKTATENVEDTDTTYTFEGQVEESNVHFNVTSSEEGATEQTIYLDAYSKNEVDDKFVKINDPITIRDEYADEARITHGGIRFEDTDAGNFAELTQTKFVVSESENAEDKEYFDIGFNGSPDTATGKVGGVHVDGSEGFKDAFNEFLGTEAIAKAAAEAIELPTVNDGKLTVSTGTGLTGSGEFTANQDGDTSITIGLDEATVESLKKADTAIQPEDLGDMAGETKADYVLKSEAPGYDDILTKEEASEEIVTKTVTIPCDDDNESGYATLGIDGEEAQLRVSAYGAGEVSITAGRTNTEFYFGDGLSSEDTDYFAMHLETDFATGSAENLSVTGSEGMKTAFNTFLGTEAKLDDFKEYVGQLPEGTSAKSVVEYVNVKTAGIATDAALEELQGQLNGVQGEVATIKGDYLKVSDKTELSNAIVGEKSRAEGVEAGLRADVDAIKADYVKDTDIADFETKENVKKVADDLAKEIKDRGDADTALDGRITTLEGKFGTGAGTVEAQIAAAVATEKQRAEGIEGGLRTDVDAVKGRMDTAEGKIAALETASATHAVKTDVEDALKLKADKSVVDAMYTNTQIDAAIQGAKDYASVTITETTDGLANDIAKKYTFTQNGKEIGSINLAKELVVTSGSVKEVTEAGKPYADAVVGDKYIELVIANQATPIYVPAKDLVDIYTAKDGADEVQVAISNTNEISATLVNGGITEEKLAEAVKTKLNKTWEEVGVAKGLVDALADGQVKANKEAIEKLNGADTVDGSVAKSIKDAIASENLGQYAKTEDLGDLAALDTITADKVTDFATEVAKVKVSEAVKATHDGNGEVIADTYAEKATTLAGYGIADAYTKNEVVAMLTWGEF